MIPPFVEDAAVWISIATVPSLIITYCAWIRRPGIARTIILAHKGQIWAENQSGGGAAFHFTLPLAA